MNQATPPPGAGHLERVHIRIRRMTAWAALLFTLTSIRMSAQHWSPLQLPAGVDYLRFAADAVRGGSLALWHTRTALADSARTSFATPWVFSVSNDAGKNWAPVDSGVFSLLLLPNGTIDRRWLDLTVVDGTTIRSIVESEAGRPYLWTVEQRGGSDPFSRLTFPWPSAQDAAPPILHLLEGGTLLSLRYDRNARPDSTIVALHVLRSGENTWTWIPDSISGRTAMHRPTSLSSRLNSRNTLFAGTLFGMRRSPNGGETWESLSSGTGLDVATVRFVVAHPRDNALVCAVGRRRAGDIVDVLYRSTDNGVTWSGVLSDTLITAVACARSNPNVILVATQSSLLRSTDGGLSWRSAQGDAPEFTGTNMVQRIAIDPDNAARAYVATPRSVLVTDDFLTDTAPLPERGGMAICSIAPSPARRSAPLTITAVLPVGGCHLDLVDLLGRRLYGEYRVNSEPGLTRWVLPSGILSSLPPGTLAVVIRTPRSVTLSPLLLLP